MQHEISRLTTENLDLQEKLDLNQETNRKLKKQNKALLKKLKELGGKIIIKVYFEFKTTCSKFNILFKAVMADFMP